jgi:hypothetical protein
MEKTWKPLTAGILNIVGGGLTLLTGLSLLLGASFFTMPFANIGITVAILSALAVPGIILGVLSVIGGIFALKRKHWGWALTGSIANALTATTLGILAIIFVAMGKDEFA